MSGPVKALALVGALPAGGAGHAAPPEEKGSARRASPALERFKALVGERVAAVARRDPRRVERAVAMADGLERGLGLIEELERAGDLAGYHLLPAAKADVLRRLGRRAEAAVAYDQALRLVAQGAERRYLERRLREMR
jgi:hypothetical protein